MENSHRYYKNSDCKYYPCHEGADPNCFNCMFCYCPLYFLGEECGGNFHYTKNGVKDCSACLIPHSEGGYEHVVDKVSEAIQKQRKGEKQI